MSRKISTPKEQIFDPNPKRHKPIPLGTVHGELTVIKELPRTTKQFKYLCKCSCGKETIAERTNILNGHTTTCGHTKGIPRGGKGNHPLYDVYIVMVGRTTNPNHASAKYYSERGVTLHPDWSNETAEGFENFFKWATTVGGWKKGLYLDKEAINHNNLIYGPDTCRFVKSNINSASARKKTSGVTSKFIGVHYPNRKRDAAWIAKIMHNGKVVTVGYFDNEITAAQARDKFIRDNNLPHRLNFPNE